MKAYPQYKSSGIDWLGEIPSHWVVCKIKHRISMVLGKMLQSKMPQVDGYSLEKYLKSRNVSMLEISGLDNLDEMWFSDSEKNIYLLKEGDVVMNEGGDIGKVALWKPLSFCCYLQNSVHKLTPNDTVNSSFLTYYLASISFLGFFQSIVSQISIAHLTKEKLANTPLVVPSYEEQEAIAGYLDEVTAKVDALMAEKRAQVEDLRKYRISLITETATRGLNPNAPIKLTNSEWFPYIPTNWSIEKFKYQATVKANLVHPTDYIHHPQISPDSIEKNTGRLLGYKSVEEAGIISDNHLFYKGQIIYSKIRPNLNKVAIAPFDGLCSADMYPIETLNNVRYFQYLMLSNPFVSQVSVVIQDRVKMPRINQVELGEIMILVPPIFEQQQIADYLDEKTAKIDSLIEELEAQLRDLATYRQAVITEAVTGKVDVRDWTPKN